ncbi:hypothetical protein [Terrihabitans sp. B22-R8]|uniref:hypothetical protein n=1 Tax=Terrihabitans sp. B22-R8 TaxID=3425128 RepID=UPI00403CB78F
MANIDLKTLLDDVRTRQKALHDLILFTDRQAMALLRLYATLSLALTSAGVASLRPGSAIPLAAGLGLLVASALFIIGALLCFQAMKQASIAFPGRDAEFWTWARRDDVTEEAALGAYLDQAGTTFAENYDLNATTAKHLARAKRLGVAAPALALIVAVGAQRIFGL